VIACVWKMTWMNLPRHLPARRSFTLNIWRRSISITFEHHFIPASICIPEHSLRSHTPVVVHPVVHSSTHWKGSPSNTLTLYQTLYYRLPRARRLKCLVYYAFTIGAVYNDGTR
jgi:hypothetical protein